MAPPDGVGVRGVELVMVPSETRGPWWPEMTTARARWDREASAAATDAIAQGLLATK